MNHVLIVLTRTRQIFLTGLAIVALWAVVLAPKSVFADDRPLVLEDNLNSPDASTRWTLTQ
jgi:hypothetical protein